MALFNIGYALLAHRSSARRRLARKGLKARGRLLQFESLEIRELLSITDHLTVGQYADPFDFVQPVASLQDSSISISASPAANGATLPVGQMENYAALAAQSLAAMSSSNPTVVVDPADGLRLSGSRIYGEWNTAGNYDGWTVANAASSGVSGGNLTVTSQSGTSNAVQISLTNISSGAYLDYGYFDYLQVRMQLPLNYNKDVTLAFGTTVNPGFSINPGAANDRSFVIPAAQVAKDGNFHTYRIDLGLAIWWRDTLRDLQIRPLGATGAGETVSIDYIEVGDMPGDVLTAYTTGLNMAPGVTAATRQSVESKHFVFWWDPAVNPGGRTNWTTMQRNAFRMLEESYQVYAKVLGFVEPFSYAGDGQRHKINLTTWYSGYWMGGPYLNVDTTGLQDEGWGNPVPHEYAHVIDGQQPGTLVGGYWESHANYLREFRTNWFYPFFSSSTQSTMELNPLAWSNYRQDMQRLIYSDYRIWLALQNISADPVFGTSGTNPLDPNLATKVWSTGASNQTVYNKLATLLPAGTSVKDVVASVLRLWPMLDFQTRNFLTAHLWSTQNAKADYDYRTGSYLIPEPDQAGWYRVPLERAPEKYAFMFHDLVPDPGSTSITVTLRGMDVYGSSEDWRWCLSEVDASSNVVAYSDVWGPGTHTFTLTSSSNKVQLIVVATPSDTSVDLDSFYNTKPVDKNIDRLNYPYEVQITGATPAVATEQLNYAKSASGHYHSNGGGWVDNTATVASTAYVGPNARVLGYAQVSNYARIEDYAVIAGSAKVQNYAVVSGFSVVKDSATVRGYARIRDHAIIGESAVVQDYARVEEFAYIISNTIVKDSAIVTGNAYPFGGTISGTAIAGYDYSYSWSFSDGTHYGHFPWGDWFDAYFNSTQKKPRGLVASYRVEETAGELLWDEFGAQHAFLRGAPTRVDDATMNSYVLQLNGTSQYALLDRSLADMTDATYGLWLNPTSADPNETLLYFGGSTGNYMKLVSRDANGLAHLTMSVGGTTQELVSTTAIPLNQWTYLALTFGSGTATFYVNGQAAGSLPTSYKPTSVLGPNDYRNAEAFYLGRDASGNYFTGRLEDIRVYNVALSSAELANEMSRAGAKIGQFLATAPMTFDGSATMMESGVHNGLARTLAAWIKPATSDDVSYYEPIFDSNDEQTSGRYGSGFGLDNGTIKVRLDGLGFWSTGVAVQLNKWQHVALAINGTTARLYVNGVLRATRSYSASANSLAGKNYRIGWGQSGSDTSTRTFFDGQIYDVQIYDRMITPTPNYGQLIAVNDSAALLSDSGATTINVLANDYDTSPVVEAVTVYSVTQGAHGTVTRLADGSAVTYTPAGGFAGLDSFTYTITDGFSHYTTASVQVTVESPVLSVSPDDWVSAGSARLTLQLGGDGKLHVYVAGTTIDAVLPHTPTWVTGISISGRNAGDVLTYDYGGAIASLLLRNATLAITQNNAISAGAAVTVDGGALDLNGKADTIGSLLLKSGSVINGTLYADAYTIESGTVTATMSSTGDLIKTTAAQATVGTVSTANTTVSGGELVADSIFTGVLTVAPGATVTIAPIDLGPLGLADPLAQTSAPTAAPAAPDAPGVDSNVAATQEAPINIETVAQSPLIATPAPTPVAEAVVNRDPARSLVYSLLDCAPLRVILDGAPAKVLIEKRNNSGRSTMLSASQEERPPRASISDKYAIPRALNRATRHAVMQILAEDARAQADFDVARHPRAAKYSGELHGAVDAVFGKGYDAVLAGI